jgi:hypothetical protein
MAAAVTNAVRNAAPTKIWAWPIWMVGVGFR